MATPLYQFEPLRVSLIWPLICLKCPQLLSYAPVAMEPDPTSLTRASLRDDLIEVGCNMHARRYFVKALEANDARAAVPLAAFKTLYDVEDRVKNASADANDWPREPETVTPRVRRRTGGVVPDLPAHGAPRLAARARRSGYLLNHRIALTRFLARTGGCPSTTASSNVSIAGRPLGVAIFLCVGSHAGARSARRDRVLGDRDVPLGRCESAELPCGRAPAPRARHRPS